MFILRWLLGVFLLAMGANKFLGFMPPMNMPIEATQLMQAMIDSGYLLPMVGITELTTGALLLFTATAPFALVLLAPLSVNIVLFHVFLAPDTIIPAAAVFTLNLVLGTYYFEYYRSIFAQIFEEKVFYRNKKGLHTGHLTATAN